MMPFEFYFLLRPNGNFHPPAVTFFTFIENQFIFFTFNFDMIFYKLTLIFMREFIFAVIISIDKIPNHLGHQMCRLPVIIKFRISFIKANGSQFITHPGITGNLTCLFAIKSIGGHIFITRGIRMPDGRNIKTD